MKNTSLNIILIFVPTIVLLFLSIILISPSLILSDGLLIKYSQTGEVGDTIGGIMGPIIAAIASLLTYLAFKVQYEANINQRNDIQLERFENQFYEMLRLHKENVSEMEIGNIKGRKCFTRMFYEFKYIYLCTYHIYLSQREYLENDYSKEKLCDLSYKIFFNGLNSINEFELNKIDKKKDAPLLIHVYRYLLSAEEYYDEQFKMDSSSSIYKTVYNEDKLNTFKFEMFYYPFDGHNTRLGHYYRHLFQTVSFIANSTILTTHKEKYHYLKLLRAQLSNHEQLLLYYNGLVSFGQEWITKKYFTDYRMIKNIPFDKADFGKLPVDKLGVKNRFGENIFEWIE